MVTALSSTRLIAAQLALKALETGDSSDDGSSTSSSSSSLLDGSSVGKNISSLPSSAQASLASMLNSLSGSQSDDSTSLDDTGTAASTDITTSSFMALLKQNLTATAAGSSDGAKQAQSMLDALNSGTLTVADPTAGVSVTAWDATTSAESSSSTSSDTTKSNAASTIPTSDWNDYLKAHLQRNADGTLSRAADNSFIDKTTGKDVYFGQVGTQFYYMSWNQADSSGSDKTAATSSASA